MNSRPLLLFLLCATLPLTACDTQRLFYASFNSDTVGSRPAASPAGDPVGDEIYMAAPGGRGPDPALVATDSDFSGRALAYSNIDIESWYRIIGFKSREITSGTTKIWASWVGKAELTNQSSNLEFWLGDTHFRAMLAFRFKNGRIHLRTSSGVDPTYEDIGSLTGGIVHSVIIHVDKSASTYELTIFQRGAGGIVRSGVRPIISSTALATLKPTLYLNFNEEASSSGTYTIDDVLISEEAPETPST